MYPFSTPGKDQKTVRFSDLFRESRKPALGTNGFIICKNKIASQLTPLGEKRYQNNRDLSTKFIKFYLLNIFYINPVNPRVIQKTEFRVVKTSPDFGRK